MIDSQRQYGVSRRASSISKGSGDQFSVNWVCVGVDAQHILDSLFLAFLGGLGVASLNDL